VLVFHGIGDRPHYWRGAQRRLAQSGIASLVFAYPGYPGSCGTTTPANLDRGAHSVYDWLREHVPVNTPVFLLGFSLGTGLAADVAGELSPAPAGIILAEAFTSLREAAGRVARPAPFLARVLPDVWKTRENVARLEIPLLIIHSTGDALFPVAMAEQLFAAARASGAPAQLEVLEGLAHNSPYLTVPEDYWQAIRQFIARNSHSAEPLTTTNLRNSPP
jgi:fermentation-respiration switch protein FrsA (DUF1100 family)